MRKEAKIEIAQKLLKETKDIQLVARVTELSLSELEKIKEALHLIPQFLMLDFSLGRITAAYHGIYNQASCCWIPWSSNGSSMFSKIKH